MEATMIKKIILLVLSFSFSVTSVVYGTVTKADPVTSGTGTGTSVKIADTSALSNVMSQIPSFDDYTGEQSISEKYPDFKPFTMIETGYGENTKDTTYRRTTVKDGEIEYVDLIQRNIETTNHSLSISFTEDAVYYHSVGSKLSTNIYYEYEISEESASYSFDTEEDFGDEDFCFVLGDVIDRGKEGVKTLLWLMNQPNFELVLGNHESMMLDCDFICEDITHKSIANLTEEKLEIYGKNEIKSTQKLSFWKTLKNLFVWQEF